MMRLAVGILAFALSAAAIPATAVERPRLPEPGLPAVGGSPFPPSAPDRALLPDPGRPGPRPGFVGEPGPPRGRICLDPAETRETVLAYRLADPFRALRAGGIQGEALRAKLCRWRPDQFVYELALLLRDGRVIHVYMNAQSGQTVGVRDPHRN